MTLLRHSANSHRYFHSKTALGPYSAVSYRLLVLYQRPENFSPSCFMLECTEILGAICLFTAMCAENFCCMRRITLKFSMKTCIFSSRVWTKGHCENINSVEIYYIWISRLTVNHPGLWLPISFMKLLRRSNPGSHHTEPNGGAEGWFLKSIRTDFRPDKFSSIAIFGKLYNWGKSRLG